MKLLNNFLTIRNAFKRAFKNKATFLIKRESKQEKKLLGQTHVCLIGPDLYFLQSFSRAVITHCGWKSDLSFQTDHVHVLNKPELIYWVQMASGLFQCQEEIECLHEKLSEKHSEEGSSRKQKLPRGAALTQVILLRCVSVQVKGSNVSDEIIIRSEILWQLHKRNRKDRNQTINTRIYLWRSRKGILHLTLKAYKLN